MSLRIKTERDQDDRVRLSVIDAGLGFAPETAEKLLEPSTQPSRPKIDPAAISAIHEESTVTASFGVAGFHGH